MNRQIIYYNTFLQPYLILFRSKLECFSLLVTSTLVQYWLSCLGACPCTRVPHGLNLGRLQPVANVIKLFTLVIYRYSMVILWLSVIKLHHLGNYHGMSVNCQGKTFTTLAYGDRLKYCSNLPKYFNPRENSYCSKLTLYFITFAPGFKY